MAKPGKEPAPTPLPTPIPIEGAVHLNPIYAKDSQTPNAWIDTNCYSYQAYGARLLAVAQEFGIQISVTCTASTTDMRVFGNNGNAEIKVLLRNSNNCKFSPNMFGGTILFYRASYVICYHCRVCADSPHSRVWVGVAIPRHPASTRVFWPMGRAVWPPGSTHEYCRAWQRTGSCLRYD